MDQKRVLFLCTGNSCRSQIAEAIVNARLMDNWQAFSAGSKPAGFVHPLAVQVLSEIGIDHHGRSKSIEEFRGEPFHLVVTLCEESEHECPVWLGKGKQVHMPFPDPSNAEGTEVEKLAVFRFIRDQMTEQITELLSNP
jgi:arsenate reductase